MGIFDYKDLSYLCTTDRRGGSTKAFVIKNLSKELIIDLFEENEYHPDINKIKEIIMALTDDEVYNLAQNISDSLEELDWWEDVLFEKVCMPIVEKLGKIEVEKMEYLQNGDTVIDKNFDDLITQHLEKLSGSLLLYLNNLKKFVLTVFFSASAF